MSNRKINYLHSSVRCNLCFRAGVSMFLDCEGGGGATGDQKPRKLLQCSDCKMISYCGIAHQRSDWKSHKQFCKTVKIILTQHKIKHLYDIDKKPIKNATITGRNNVMAFILIKMAILMKRNLSAEEYQLIKYPKMCSICYEYDIQSLKICMKCKCGIYCRSHAKVFENQHSQMLCEQMRIWHDWCEDLNYSETLSIVPKFHDKTSTKFPHDIFELISGLLNVRISHQPNSLEDFNKFNALGGFSDIATILYILLQPATHSYFDHCTTLEIHLVGASRELAYFTKNECFLFAHWLPEHIHSININLIGPEVEFEDKFEYLFDRKLVVTIEAYKKLYESYLAEHNIDPPQLICCFNSGFCEFDKKFSEYNPWIPALRKMLKHEFANGECVPIAFTSYIQDEVVDDKQLLESLATDVCVEIKWIVDGVVNPCRHCKPERDNQERFYHINNYLSVFIPHKK